MALSRTRWSNDFGRTLVSQHGRKLPVQFGSAWTLGCCTVHIDIEQDAESTVLVHVLEEPRDGGKRDAAPNSMDFRYDLRESDPFVAASMVARWVLSREGD